MTLIFPGPVIEYDHATITVSIGNVNFICFGVEPGFRGTLQVSDVIAALALAGFADLHQKLSLWRELQDHAVMERRTRAVCRIPPSGAHRVAYRARCRTGSTVATDPDVAIRIDRNSVHRVRPIVSLAGPSPVTYQIARLVELQHRGRRGATIGGRRILRRIGFHSFQGSRAVNNPDMVLCIDGDPDDISHDPMIRKRLRPERVNLETRSLGFRGLSCKDGNTDTANGLGMAEGVLRASGRGAGEEKSEVACKTHKEFPNKVHRQFIKAMDSMAWSLLLKLEIKQMPVLHGYLSRPSCDCAADEIEKPKPGTEAVFGLGIVEVSGLKKDSLGAVLLFSEGIVWIR